MSSKVSKDSAESSVSDVMIIAKIKEPHNPNAFNRSRDQSSTLKVINK